MRRRRPTSSQPTPLAIALDDDCRTGNVQLLPRQRDTDLRIADADRLGADGPLAEPRWTIRDGAGVPLEPALDSRAAALRRMGVLAYRGATLPLTLDGPDGRPTGDRLA